MRAKAGYINSLRKLFCIRVSVSWLNLFFLAPCLGIVVFVVRIQAKWLNPEPSLLTILLIALLFGFFNRPESTMEPDYLSVYPPLQAVSIFWQCCG